LCVKDEPLTTTRRSADDDPNAEANDMYIDPPLDATFASKLQPTTVKSPEDDESAPPAPFATQFVNEQEENTSTDGIAREGKAIYKSDQIAPPDPFVE